VIRERNRIRSLIGYMPENDALIANMTAVSMVRMMGELSGMQAKAALERAHEVLFYVGLGEARYRELGTYSLGMRQLAKLAQAIVHGPKLLILDEPTNDLDIETLEVLEDLLLDYDGTLLLVSHDRAFLNNIVTSTLILDGTGKVSEYVGGYDDWHKQIEQPPAPQTKPKTVSDSRAESKAEPKRLARKLSYNEKRELEELPGLIEILEAEQHELTVKMEDPAFYQQEGAVITQAVNRLQEVHDELARVYQRWVELEA